MPDNRFPYITSPNRIYNASYVHVFNPEDPVSVRHDSESNRHYSESNVDQIKIMAEKVLRVLRLALGRGLLECTQQLVLLYLSPSTKKKNKT
jgi:hypothetical protein